MLEVKKWDVPEELHEILVEALASEDCRDSSVKNFFGFSRALKYAVKARKLHRKFWKKVYELYPETESLKIEYHEDDRLVSEIKK